MKTYEQLLKLRPQHSRLSSAIFWAQMLRAREKMEPNRTRTVE